MKAICVMFDSLNRHMLPCYGDTWVHAPNFARLAERTVTFDRSYVCSMPCMPARRDMHTGRPNFLHRGWGPLEPFDVSVPQMLQEADISTHLLTDHYHYFEDGGCTYHTRFSTWQFSRGQEGDPWVGQVAEPPIPDNINGKGRRQDWVNRQFMQNENQMPAFGTFTAAADFINRNHDQDNWYLQVETFDPHEPFWSDQKYKDLYKKHYDSYDGPLFDWPGYEAPTESPEQIEHARHEYAALLSMCDARLGEVLDLMDKHNMWDDTMLIVMTDHGYLLGEHNCWAKNWMPMFEQVAHTPFFVWDPRCGKKNEHRQALVQPAIDMGPTLLDFFGQPLGANMLGKVLTDAVADDTPVRSHAIFGYHASRVNITDGRYVYMRGNHEAGVPINDYTLMPTNMRGFISQSDDRPVSLVEPFSFTQDQQVLCIRRSMTKDRGDADPLQHNLYGDLLYDLQTDPQQEDPVDSPKIEDEMIAAMTDLMYQCDAPAEVYTRLGLKQPA